MKTEFVCKFCGSKKLKIVIVPMVVRGENRCHHKLVCCECDKYQKFLGPTERAAFDNRDLTTHKEMAEKLTQLTQDAK